MNIEILSCFEPCEGGEQRLEMLVVLTGLCILRMSLILLLLQASLGHLQSLTQLTNLIVKQAMQNKLRFK